MIEDSLSEPGESGGAGLLSACLREVQKDLAQSAKRLIESKLSEHRLGSADGFRIFKDCIETPGDGLIIFKGMNDYTADSIKSLEGFKRAWWEEAHTATKRSINLLRPTMRAPGSQLWWSYNRSRPVDAVDEMFSGDEIPTGAVVVDANWRDNPWFTPELEQERLDCLRMQPEQYAHIWDGDYITVSEGAYFAKGLAAAREEGRIGKVSADPLMTIRAYCDLGGTGAKADAFAIWIVQFIGREVRVLDHYEAEGQPIAEHVAWLRSSGYGKASIYLPHDGLTESGPTPGSWESAFRDAGFAVQTLHKEGSGRTGAKSVRIEAVRRLMPSIWFDEARCDAGLRALGWYHEKRDEARGVGLGPDHDWSSHSADAFGLMCIDYEPPRKSAPIDYSRIRKGVA